MTDKWHLDGEWSAPITSDLAEVDPAAVKGFVLDGVGDLHPFDQPNKEK